MCIYSLIIFNHNLKFEKSEGSCYVIWHFRRKSRACSKMMHAFYMYAYKYAIQDLSKIIRFSIVQVAIRLQTLTR